MDSKLFICGLVFIFSCSTSEVPVGQFAHSHNDYYQERPFHDAYECYFGSIEVDVWALEGELFVAHDHWEIEPGKTFESMYLEPIRDVFEKNGGRAWSDYDGTFILLVDLKTSYSPALDILVDIISGYPELFDHNVNPDAVSVVVSGDMSPPGMFHLYPHYIWFDGRMANSYDEQQLERVKLFSSHFRSLSSWDGFGEIPDEEREIIMDYIRRAGDTGKKTRFWATPDHEEAWKTLLELGVGYVNTDHPVKFAETMSAR